MKDKKDSKDKKKLVYEVPKLVKLNGNDGKGQFDCTDGSGDFSCLTGNGAVASCTVGNTATNYCNTGGANEP